MVHLYQPCEGPNATAVSTSNALGNNQWDGFGVTGTGTTLTWDNAQKLLGDSTWMKVHWPAAAATAYTEWKAKIPSALSNMYLRFGFYMSARPSVQMRIASPMTGTNAINISLNMGTAGKLQVNNPSGTMYTGMQTTNSLNASTFYRVELDLTGVSGTTGNIALRVYSGANLFGYTPDTGQSVSITGATVGGLTNAVRIASSGGQTLTAAIDQWFGEVEVDDTVQPGPFRAAIWGVAA